VNEQQRRKNANRRKRRRRKARGTSLRVRIVAACSQREVTPREIADREGLPVSTVSYHFQALEKQGYLRVSRKEPARGLRRHYYVANRQKVITDEEFAAMTKEEQHAATEALLRDLLEHCREALKAGTLDARPDSHLSWSPLSLDEQGWEELQNDLDRMLERSLQIQAESRARLDKSGEEPIPTTFAIVGFEGPTP
jgi:DNA-binding transcriptional regulator GbsR (MarR family)